MTYCKIGSRKMTNHKSELSLSPDPLFPMSNSNLAIMGLDYVWHPLAYSLCEKLVKIIKYKSHHYHLTPKILKFCRLKFDS